MLSTIEIILLLILVSVLTFGIWNWSTLRGLKDHSSRRIANLDDAKYWELKSKQEFLVAVVTIVTAVIAFLGYNSKKDIEYEVKNAVKANSDSVRKVIESQLLPVSQRVDSTDRKQKDAEGRISASEQRIIKYQSQIIKLNNQRLLLDKLASQSKKDVGGIISKIAEINSRNILKQEIYVCKAIWKDIETYKPQKLEFENLTTLTGDRLPVFKKPPIVVPVSAFNFAISNVTLTGFNILMLGGYDPNSPEIISGDAHFTIMIYETP